MTCLDLVEESIDALNDLTNRTYALKLGYVGVVLRGTKESSKTIAE